MHWNFYRSLIAALAFLPAICPGQATIEGKVELPKRVYAPVVNQRYDIVTKANVQTPNPPRAIVYLEGNFPKPSPTPTTVSQKGFAFLPPLLAIELKTKVAFPNLDDEYHNIFSYSPAKRFDLGRYPPGETPPPIEFDRPGLVTLRCDIHEHMRGLILVVDTPYSVISETDGRYVLTGLPAGHFTLKAWTDSRTTRERPVELHNGATLHVDFP